MEKTIKSRRTRGLLNEYKEFKKSWIRAGKPQFFIWSSETGGRSHSAESFRLHQRFEKMKVRRDLKKLKKNNF
jgi:hypothetical protein